MKKLLMIAFVLFIAACTHNPNEVVAVEKGGDLYVTDEAAAEEVAEGNSENVICERRVITGSHRVTRVCTTKEQKQDDREEARRLLDRSQLKSGRDVVPLDN